MTGPLPLPPTTPIIPLKLKSPAASLNFWTAAVPVRARQRLVKAMATNYLAKTKAVACGPEAAAAVKTLVAVRPSPVISVIVVGQLAAPAAVPIALAPWIVRLMATNLPVKIAASAPGLTAAVPAPARPRLVAATATPPLVKTKMAARGAGAAIRRIQA